MSSESEVLLYQPFLKNVLAYHRLSIPLFQRPYSWGAPKKDYAAKRYFLEFLTNPNAIKFFGYVTVYATTRYNFEDGTNIEANVADGQHRLVTVVLGALAIRATLKHVEQQNNGGASKQAADLLSAHHKLLAMLTSSNIEVKLGPGATPVRLKDLIRGQATRLAELALDRRRIELDYRENLLDIRDSVGAEERRVAKKNKTVNRNQERERVSQKEKELESIHAWRSYQLLREALIRPDDQDFAECLSRCEVFLGRLEDYRIPMVCLVPRRNGEASLSMLESEGFSVHSRGTSTTAAPTFVAVQTRTGASATCRAAQFSYRPARF